MIAHEVGQLWTFLASEINEWAMGGYATQDVESSTTQRCPVQI